MRRQPKKSKYLCAQVLNTHKSSPNAKEIWLMGSSGVTGTEGLDGNPAREGNWWWRLGGQTGLLGKPSGRWEEGRGLQTLSRQRLQLHQVVVGLE
jgi:hypothetical protein